ASLAVSRGAACATGDPVAGGAGSHACTAGKLGLALKPARAPRAAISASEPTRQSPSSLDQNAEGEFRASPPRNHLAWPVSFSKPLDTPVFPQRPVKRQVAPSSWLGRSARAAARCPVFSKDR